MDKLPQRKNIRLQNYDYSQTGYYFITICTKDRKNLLCEIIGDGFPDTPITELTSIGQEITKSIKFIDNQNYNVHIDRYVIMPNHIHLIIVLQNDQQVGHGNLNLQKIVGQLKSYTNKMYNDLNKTKNMILWQRNYYDHIIRNEHEYQSICEYIENNPFKWNEDEYYL